MRGTVIHYVSDNWVLFTGQADAVMWPEDYDRS
jgi:hypothetical protein